MTRALVLAALLGHPALAGAQPAAPPPAAPVAAPPLAAPAAAPPAVVAEPPLAEIKDEKQLAAALAQITQDPSIAVEDPRIRARAQALMIEGVQQLNARAYDQALANFLEAYGTLPSPRILLNIGSTLREMGRAADAANTYQRYINAPGSGVDRSAEVRPLLAQLDAQLTILEVHVSPRASDISIDAGPFLPVGSTLVTRVRAGIHLVRIRHGRKSAEISVNGFEGETKEVAAALPVEVDAAPPPTPPVPVPVPGKRTPPPPTPPPPPPDRVDAWLSTGTSYTSGDPGGNARGVRAGFQGEEILPIVPDYSAYDSGGVLLVPESHIASGLLAMTRIDGRGRGVAGGFGLALSPSDHFEVELAVLRSEQWGAYAGARYRLLTGPIRPYVGVGVPIFAYDDDRVAGDPTRVAYGIRGAGGVELRINGHFSVQADVGFERFYHLSGTSFDASLVVPTLGVVGRL